MLRVRWTVRAGHESVREVVVDADTLSIQDSLVIFKDKDGQALLIVRQDRLVDAVAVTE